MGKTKYSEAFRQEAVELVRRIGVTKASKELKLAHCTLYRWCRDSVAETGMEDEGQESTNLDTVVESYVEEQLPSATEEPETDTVPGEDENTQTADDPVSTAMAMLVIENMHLREIIRNMRETLSGMTDHQLI